MQAVTVAEGSRLHCQCMCKNFEWKLQEATFTTNMLLILLRSCDVILGVQWLSTLGVVKWDFKNLKMEFSYKRRVHAVRGIRQEIKLVTKDKLSKTMAHLVQMCMLQVCHATI